jgi:hypothetical protein
MYQEDDDQDNLGIYDDNNIDYNNYADIQGVSFMDYRKTFTTAGSDEHKLLTESSSPTLGSIIEAMNETESVGGYKTAAEQTLSADEDAFNALLSQYTTAYNTYISSNYMTNAKNGIKPSPTDSSNNALQQANLQSLNERLLILAKTIVEQINNLKTTTHSNLRASIQEKQASLRQRIDKLKEQRNKIDNINNSFDVDSIDGAIETSSLNMDSFYLHYIVYFFIGIVLLVFIFNISVNPEANTTRATFFLAALFSVYIISRWVNK